MLRDLLHQLDHALAARAAPLAVLVCLMPLYAIVLLMLLVDPPSWVTGVVYLLLALCAVVPLLPRARLLLAAPTRAANLAFVALLAVVVVSWALRSRGDPLADKAIALAPMLMVAPMVAAQLLTTRREQRALFTWVAAIGTLVAIALLYWLFFGLLEGKPRMQFGLGVRIYLGDDHWTGQRVYIDPIGTAWLCGMVAAICAVSADRLRQRSRLVRAILFAIALTCGWLVLRSTGRSALLAWCCAAALYLGLLCERPLRQRLVIAGALVAIAVAMFASLPQGTRAYYLGTAGTFAWEQPRELTQDQPGMTSADHAARNVLRRQLVWRDHLQVFLEHPLVGVGHGAAHRHADVAVDRLSHNLFVEMAAGSGVIGLTALLAFLAALARVARRLLDRTRGLRDESRTVAILATLFLAASVVQLNLSATLTGFPPLYAAAGLLLALYREHHTARGA